jgi:hypothetical protein
MTVTAGASTFAGSGLPQPLNGTRQATAMMTTMRPEEKD